MSPNSEPTRDRVSHLRHRLHIEGQLPHTHILAIDNSPIEISQLEVDGRILKPKSQMCFPIQFDLETGHYDLEGRFDIVLSAETRSEIETQLFSELAMLWMEYVEAPVEILTNAARKLREELVASFEVLTNAS